MGWVGKNGGWVKMGGGSQEYMVWKGDHLAGGGGLGYPCLETRACLLIKLTVILYSLK
jgi:hypothetical protein